jgi:hypothetical protein
MVERSSPRGVRRSRFFHARRLTHTGTVQALLQRRCEHRAVLNIDQHGESFRERNPLDLGLLKLQVERIGHGAEAQSVQFLDGRLVHIRPWGLSWLAVLLCQSSMVVVATSNVFVMANTAIGRRIGDRPADLE